MKLLSVSLLALFASVLLTRLLSQDPGYVMVSYNGWTLETSLVVAALLLLLLFALSNLVLRLLRQLWTAPRRLRHWEQRRQQRRARRSLLQGLVELAEGNWEQAEALLLRDVETAEMPLLNYLSAARATQQQGAHERRDHYLRLAHGNMPAAQMAIGLTQAELQLAHQQYEQALATLMHLRRQAPQHTYVLRLLRTLYERLADWRNLLDLLPELRRHKIVANDELEALELRAQLALLKQLAQRADTQALQTYWKPLPKRLRCHPAMVDAYSASLLERGETATVERLLRESLDKCWSQNLVQRYGSLEAEDMAAQLAAAEQWLNQHSGDSVLLYTLGRLCLKNRLWGKARSYFEASIGAGGRLRPAAYRDLGSLLEQMGEDRAAMDCYRQGLQLSTHEQNAPEPVSRVLAFNRAQVKRQDRPA